MSLYSSLDCSSSWYSQVYWNSSLNQYSIQRPPCSIHLSQIIGWRSLYAARYIGIFSMLVYAAVGFYRIYRIFMQEAGNKSVMTMVRESTRDGLSSAPLMTYLFLTVFNIALLLGFVDPGRAFGLYSVYFRAFLVWIIAFCLFSLLVILVYKMWYSILIEFDGGLLSASYRPFYARTMFMQLFVVSFLIAFPTESSTMEGIQSILIAAESLLFGLICFWFGYRLHENLKAHELKLNVDYSRALFKIRLLLVAIVLCMTISVVSNSRDAAMQFRKSKAEVDVLTNRRILLGFWISVGFLYFISALNNVVSFIVFSKPKKNSSKAGTRGSQKKDGPIKKPESSPVTGDSGDSTRKNSTGEGAATTVTLKPISIHVEMQAQKELT